MQNLKKFKVKFFGSKNRKEQIQQFKLNIEIESKDKIEEHLKRFYGFQIINGLKINEIK
jgi:hypothetical protein